MNTAKGSPFSPLPSPVFGAALVLCGTVAGAGAALAFGIVGACAAVILACGLTYVALSRKAPGKPILEGALAAETVAESISADRIDPLTGLANENGLMAWFGEKGARLAADGKGIVVLVAKLDEFDRIESARGKVVADAVLKEIASRVAVVAGEEGIAARTNGEEFASVVAVVPNRSEAVAEERAGHLLDLIGRPVEHSSGVIWVGGSVGAAAGSPAAGKETLERARSALTRAVRMGRGQFVVDPPVKS